MNKEVKKLIVRKLRHKKREQVRLWGSVVQKAYAKLHEDTLANIGSRKLGRAFTSVPLAAYRQITTGAIIVTKEWPGIVWEATASLLKEAHVVLHDGQELNTILNEFAWGTGQKPFTLEYIDPDRFSEIVNREAHRFGVDLNDIADSFNRQLSLAATTAKCEIINTSRQAREGIGIAIEEYLIAQKGYGNTEPEETAAQRKKRLNTWFREEVRSGGERGAINRVAKREGISRQRLSIILNRSN